MIPLLTAAAYLTGASVVGWLLARHRDARRPARKALLAWLAVGGASQLVTVHSVYRAIDDTVGHTNTAIVISHSLGLVACAFAEIMYVCWIYDPSAIRRPAVWRIAVMSAAIVALIVLFALTPQASESPQSWRLDNIELTTVALYSIVFSAALTWSLLDLGRLSVRYSRLVVTPQTRIGLILFAVGTLFGLCYTGLAAVDGALGLAGTHLPDHTPISLLLTLIAIVLLALGAIIPAVTTATIHITRRTRQAHLCRQMEPLYKDIATTVPEVLQGKPRYGWIGWLTNWYGNGRKLSQRTIETYDGLAELRPWMDELAYSTGRELAVQADHDDDSAAIIAEATRVADALRRRAAGATPHDVHVPMVQVADDGEAVRLAKISHAYASDLVRTKALQAVTQRRSQMPAPR